MKLQVRIVLGDSSYKYIWGTIEGDMPQAALEAAWFARELTTPWIAGEPGHYVRWERVEEVRFEVVG